MLPGAQQLRPPFSPAVRQMQPQWGDPSKMAAPRQIMMAQQQQQAQQPMMMQQPQPVVMQEPSKFLSALNSSVRHFVNKTCVRRKPQ
jgi:hypothetical protein